MDFDATRQREQDTLAAEFGDHSFTLGGETFHIRRIIPFGVVATLAGVTKEGSTDADAFQAVEKAVLSLLRTQEDRDRFRQVLYDTETDYPVTFTEMIAIQNWMMQEASGRPPTQPASSSESPSRNGASETATSSPAPAEASTS